MLKNTLHLSSMTFLHNIYFEQNNMTVVFICNAFVHFCCHDNTDVCNILIINYFQALLSLVTMFLRHDGSFVLELKL